MTFHLWISLKENLSSQSIFQSQSSWRNNFMGRVAGVSNPSGSKIDAIAVKTARLVVTICMSINFLVGIDNVSNLTFQSSPSTLVIFSFILSSFLKLQLSSCEFDNQSRRFIDASPNIFLQFWYNSKASYSLSTPAIKLST